MAGERVRGVELRGEEPKRLALSDGSRLMLDGGAPDGGRIEWKRVGRLPAQGGPKRMSVPEAASLAGDEFSGYVVTRSRCEAQWLRTVADWYRDEADRLDEEVALARR
jgi:hypothetical protein